MIFEGPPIPQQQDLDIILTMRESVNTERNILDKENNYKYDLGKGATNLQLDEKSTSK